MLKNLIVEISENSYQLPYLTKRRTSNDSLEESPNHLQDFKSYEELLAAAIINQVNSVVFIIFETFFYQVMNGKH
jgi:hypothetical protein